MVKAKQQFKASCVALEASRKANALTLRFFVGDAIALSKALSKYGKSGSLKTEVFAAPWRAAPIDLTEHANSVPNPPVSFDVIDTSMLADTLGLFNLLLVTQPLLKKKPESQAIAYTDLKFGARGAFKNFMLDLCSDVAKARLLVGLVPRPYLSLFTSHSNTHELQPGNDGGFMERVAWVDPTGGDKLAYEEPKPTGCLNVDNLIRMMFGLHRSLFFGDVCPPANAFDFNRVQLYMSSPAHYTSETVADLSSHLQNRVHVTALSFSAAIRGLVRFVEQMTENPLAVSNCAEMKLQHELRGLWYDLEDPQETVPTAGVFQNWLGVPQEVCVVLTVPRARLDPLRGDKERFSPRLVCTIKDPSRNDSPSTYTCIHSAWGICVPLDESSDRFAIEEDLDGFRGQSDLVVSFWANSDALVAPNLRLSFALRYTPLTYVDYFHKLGQELNLYTTTINDRDHVRVLRERPMGLSQTQKTAGFLSSPTAHSGGVRHRLTVFEEGLMWPCHLIETQIDIKSEAEQAALVSGAQVATAQIGPCTLRVSIGEVGHIVKLPYPIRGAMVRGRIDSETHRIYLDLRNAIRNPGKFQWLIEHTASQMSDRERFVRHCTNLAIRRPSDRLVNVKDVITTLIQVYSGLRQARRVMFTFCEPSHGAYMAICIGGLRLDLNAATVVLDAAVIPWLPNVEKLIDSKTPIHEIHTPVSDVPTWKHLIAACVERCRVCLYGPNCEYKSTSGAPRLGDVKDDPLCSCGRGLGFKSSDWKVALRESLLPYATRAAISPLFGVPYLEQILGPGSALQDAQQPVSWD
ncbi:hypothetical protein FRC09_000610 [Ceratobasidium sp. 395]|nr:hypothetical protein FRC09_000610 [Ceratobasidium sp. 395]